MAMPALPSTTVSRRKKLWRFLLVLFFLLLTAILATEIIRRGRKAPPVNTRIESKDMTYLVYSKQNRKSMEIRCRETQPGSDDKLYLKTIRAVIFQKGRMAKDVQVYGNQGEVFYNFNFFVIRDHARIVSGDLALTSSRFELRDQEYLTTSEPVEFKLNRSLSGRSAQGLESYLNDNSLRLFQVEGSFLSQGKNYFFNSDQLWVFSDDEFLVMSGKNRLRSEDSQLQGKLLYVRFGKDFRDIQMSTSLGRSRFVQEKSFPDRPAQWCDFRSNLMRCTYDGGTAVKEILAQDNGSLILEDGKNRSEIQSDQITAWFDQATQTARRIRAEYPAQALARGDQRVTLKGYEIEMRYDPLGQFESLQARRGGEFQLDEFQGTAVAVDYDTTKARVILQGRETKVQGEDWSFVSSYFQIDAKNRQLRTDRHVRAVLMMNGRGPLFSSGDRVFVTAGGLLLSRDNPVGRPANDGDRISFHRPVTLFQGETELRSDRLDLIRRRDELSATGAVFLKFKNEADEIILQGDRIVSDPAGRMVTVTGNGSLRSAGRELRAAQIVLRFAADDQLESIRGDEAVVFVKDPIRGRCDRLDWQYRRQEALLSGNAEISRGQEGTTRGKILRLDLNTNEIFVSGENRRSETVLEQKTPGN